MYLYMINLTTKRTYGPVKMDRQDDYGLQCSEQLRDEHEEKGGVRREGER